MNNKSTHHRLKLSPNEEQELIRQERKKWQIFRLKQVREASKFESARILGNCGAKKNAIVKEIREDMRQQWQQQHENKLQDLEQQYHKCLESVGSAHLEAQKQVDITQIKAQEAKINRQKAISRGNEALNAESKIQEKKQNQYLYRIRPVLKARHDEKCRAQKISNLPVPRSLQPLKNPPKKEPAKVTVYEAGNFCTSQYKPDITPVRKEDAVIINPREAARLEQQRNDEIIAKKEKQKIKRENLIIERGKQALIKELKKQRLNKLIEQMELANQKHQISAYLQGADQSKNESDDVSKTIQDVANSAAKKLLETEITDESTSDAAIEYTDLQEIGEISTDSAESIDILGKSIDKNKFLSVLQQIKNAKKQQSWEPSKTSFTENLDTQQTTKSPTHKEASITSPHKHVPYHEDEISTHDTTDNNQINHEETCKHCSNKDNIHFKATVPIHEMSQAFQNRRSTQNDFDSNLENLVIKFNTDSSDISSDYSSTITNSKSNFETSTPIENDKRYIGRNSGGDDTSSTSYYSLPSQIYDNLQKIKGNREKIEAIINNRPKSSDSECIVSPSETNISSFKRTPRYYTTPLKEDGSGERPVRKKDKFEKVKKDLIHQYLQRLLSTDPSILKDLSTSSVEGSGITLSSLGFMNSNSEMSSDNSDKSNSDCLSYVTLDSTAIKEYCELDQVPTKLTSTDSDQSNVVTSDCVSKSIPSQPSQSSSSLSSRPCSRDARQIPCNYEIPSKHHSPTENNNWKQQVHCMDNTSSFDGREVTSSIFSSSSIPSLKSNFKENKSYESSTSDFSDNSDNRPYNNTDKQNIVHSEDESSTTTSIPDMTAVLLKFGIPPWAQTMVKRMDVADDHSSSDTT